MPLTDTRVRTAKGKSTPYKLSDAGGLYLLVRPNGARYWRMDYRFGGRRGTLSFGVYPSISLAEARKERDIARKHVATGIDPGAKRKLDKLAAAKGRENTFRAIAEEWVEKLVREGRAETTLDKIRWILGFADPVIGSRPIAEVTAPELLIALRTVETRGRFETARRLRSTCGQVFRYAVATGRAERDPSADLRGALVNPKVRHRPAIIEPKAIGALLRAIDGFEGQPTTKAALQLAALTFVRPGEIRQAEWSEFDLSASEWCIPAGKMKMRRPHRVPLARQAVAILREVSKFTSNSRFVFPSIRSLDRCMSENTLNAALRRLGYSKDEITTHGFRSTASTRLNEMGCWNPDAIERQLAHQEANDVRRAYIHAAEYWSERQEMMQAWADYLDDLRSTVVKIPTTKTA